MSLALTHYAYGKSQIRLARVTRHADRHELKELCVAVQLEGDFAASYLAGDNRNIVATDTMKNIVYILAKKHGIGAIESFGETVGRHMLQTYVQVRSATIDLVEHSWGPIVIDGRDHPHAFVGGASDMRSAVVTLTRQGLRVESGVRELSLLKTTDSAFAGFIRDEYTTLPETEDRILATLLSARWLWGRTPADWDRAYQAVRQTLLVTFAGHRSLSIQQTLHAMGTAALAICPEIEEITMTMPNRHYLLANLGPFKLANQNEVFVVTDEPHGLIKGTLSRGSG
jgi:urate oxidase